MTYYVSSGMLNPTHSLTICELAVWKAGANSVCMLVTKLALIALYY